MPEQGWLRIDQGSYGDGFRRQHGQDFPPLALTVYAKAEDRVRALAGGYQVHLSKPVEPAEFVLVVANLAGRGQSS